MLETETFVLVSEPDRAAVKPKVAIWWRKVARRLLNGASHMLSFEAAMTISKQVLEAQGFGAGGTMQSSGELGVFKLVAAEAPMLFDVGGHIGEYTEKFLERFPQGRSYVFEPSGSHLALLRQRLGDRPEVRIFPLGLGAEAGQATLYKDREISGLASLSQRRLDYLNIKMEQTETVSISTVDRIVEETGLTSIELLKIDVEGHELFVLRGAAKAMERGIIKLVQFEFGGTDLDTHTNLQDFYYFFKTFNFIIGLIQPSTCIRLLDQYDEFYEQYRTTNFIAGPRAILGG
jgi:FkbM family methyltransferase